MENKNKVKVHKALLLCGFNLHIDDKIRLNKKKNGYHDLILMQFGSLYFGSSFSFSTILIDVIPFSR